MWPSQIGLRVRTIGVTSIGQHDIGPNPCSSLHHGKLRDEGIGMKAYTMPEADVMLNHCVTSHTHLVADVVQLPNQHPMPSLKVLPDNVPRIDDGMGTNHGPLSNMGFQV